MEGGGHLPQGREPQDRKELDPLAQYILPTPSEMPRHDWLEQSQAIIRQLDSWLQPESLAAAAESPTAPSASACRLPSPHIEQAAHSKMLSIVFLQDFVAVSKDLQKKGYPSQADVIRAMGIRQDDFCIDQQDEYGEIDISDSEDDVGSDHLSHGCSAICTSEEMPVH